MVGVMTASIILAIHEKQTTYIGMHSYLYTPSLLIRISDLARRYVHGGDAYCEVSEGNSSASQATPTY